jgi:hypothetical protein
MTSEQRRPLTLQIARIPENVRTAFERAFHAWKATWFAGALALNSNPASRASGPEFETLRACGPTILPLIVRELTNPENFMALQLYDVLQTDERLRVHFAPSDPKIAEGEQGRARRTVDAWCDHFKKSAPPG